MRNGGASANTRGVQRYEARRRVARPPWWETRLVRIGVPIVVAGALLAGFVVKNQDSLDSHCGTSDAWLSSLNGECVGVTDGSYDIYQPSDATIRQVEHTILTQNDAAVAAHQASPRRSYITLVYVGALKSSSGTADGLTAKRESLEGLAVAQSQENSTEDRTSPLVRILIANAGRAMGHGPWLAAELGRMAAQDHSIVGVVGLDQSRVPTERQITALTEVGIPMVAATLSADGLVNIEPDVLPGGTARQPGGRRSSGVCRAPAAFRSGEVARDPHLLLLRRLRRLQLEPAR